MTPQVQPEIPLSYAEAQRRLRAAFTSPPYAADEMRLPAARREMPLNGEMPRHAFGSVRASPPPAPADAAEFFFLTQVAQAGPMVFRASVQSGAQRAPRLASLLPREDAPAGGACRDAVVHGKCPSLPSSQQPMSR